MVLPVVLVVEVVAVLDVVGAVVGVVVGAVDWVGAACSVTVVVVPPPHAATPSAITTARADATAAYLPGLT